MGLLACQWGHWLRRVSPQSECRQTPKSVCADCRHCCNCLRLAGVLCLCVHVFRSLRVPGCWRVPTTRTPLALSGRPWASCSTCRYGVLEGPADLRDVAASHAVRPLQFCSQPLADFAVNRLGVMQSTPCRFHSQIDPLFWSCCAELSPQAIDTCRTCSHFGVSHLNPLNASASFYITLPPPTHTPHTHLLLYPMLYPMCCQHTLACCPAPPLPPPTHTQACIREGLRLFSPAANGSWRLCTTADIALSKDVTLPRVRGVLLWRGGLVWLAGCALDALIDGYGVV